MYLCEAGCVWVRVFVYDCGCVSMGRSMSAYRGDFGRIRG